MTIAEELMEEGRRRGLLEGQRAGRAEGRVETQRETLLRVLSHRFGVVPTDVCERLMAASSVELDGWLVRALDAPSFDAVFVTQHLSS